MAPIRAFVGHSFTDDDAEIVGQFLKYFEQISKSHPHFTWVHAEAAEPKELVDKVKALLSDRNVFIGICTRKERVVLQKNLTRSILRPNSLTGRASAFEWKTSDWIIQEIGLAAGRDLALMLLIEDGVRKPGGLQGDVEYISFDRKYPAKSFIKIL